MLGAGLRRAVTILAMAALLSPVGLSGGSTNLESSLLTIQDAIASGDLSAAEQQIDSLLKEHPGEGGLYNLRGIVHAQKNEMPDAEADFQKAVQLAPRLTPAWQNLARACQMKESACAVRAWQQVERLNPKNIEAHERLARLYATDGRFADSLLQVQVVPVAADVDAALIECADLAHLGRNAEAMKLADKVADRADFSERDWSGVSALFRDGAEAALVVPLVGGLEHRQAAGVGSLKDLAVAYEQLGRLQEARTTLERIAARDPSNAEHLVELARLAEQAKDYEGALGYLAHARDLSPKDAQLHYLFAMVANELNLPVEARNSLTTALALQPDNPAYNFAMGFVIMSTRDAATATTYFEKFVAAKPELAKGHYALGIAYFAAGDYVRSKEEMRRVMDDRTTAGGADYFLGRIAKQEDDLEAAMKYLQESIRVLPGFSESHTELARVYMQRENLADAKRELTTAVRLDPQSFRANEELLALYRRTHDPQADQQAALLKKLDEARSKRAELMLRTIEVRP